jgi:hypothetical protein
VIFQTESLCVRQLRATRLIFPYVHPAQSEFLFRCYSDPMLTMAWRAGGVRARSNPRAHRGRKGARRGAGCQDGAETEADAAPAEGGDQAPGSWRRNPCRNRAQLQRQPGDDFTVDRVGEITPPTFSEEGQQRFLQQAFSLWIMPEIQRRTDEGALPPNFQLLAAQIVFWPDGRPLEVRLNTEVRCSFLVEPLTHRCIPVAAGRLAGPIARLLAAHLKTGTSVSPIKQA